VHLPMNHPNIIRLLDVYELEDCVMMAMERAEGRDLQSFINVRASPKFSESVTRVLFQQLFDAMDYIHNTQRVIHCDMKPENILFGRDLLGDTVTSLGLFNRAKICDFGNARPARDAKYARVTFVSILPGQMARLVDVAGITTKPAAYRWYPFQKSLGP
jgi:serine/threonine protein kinase